MFKIRLSGTSAECAAAVVVLCSVFQVHEVSSFYVNRGSITLGRVYVTVRLISPATGEIYVSLGGQS